MGHGNEAKHHMATSNRFHHLRLEWTIKKVRFFEKPAFFVEIEISKYKAN